MTARYLLSSSNLLARFSRTDPCAGAKTEPYIEGILIILTLAMLISISPHTTVAELLQDFPPAIAVFLKRRMHCVGCSLSTFETLEDAAKIYGIPFDCFLKDIQRVLHITNHSGERFNSSSPKQSNHS